MRGKYVRQVQQRDLEFNLINTFDSVEDAVKATGITKGQIYNCLNGRQYQTHGYVFLWQEDYDRFVAEKPVERNVAANVWIKLKDGSCHCWPAGLVESILLPPSVTGSGLAERVEYR